MRFLQYPLVPKVSSFTEDTLFWFFSLISTYLLVYASNIPKYLSVSFSSRILNFFLFLFWFGCSIPSAMCRFPLLMIRIVNFSMPNSILIWWLYILTACIFQFFFIFDKLFDVVHVHLVIDHFQRFVKFVSSCAFPKYIKWHHHYYSNGDRPSPWKIPHWIFTSAMRFPPAVNSTLQFFIIFLKNFMTLSDIKNNLRWFIIQLCGTISHTFL